MMPALETCSVPTVTVGSASPVYSNAPPAVISAPTESSPTEILPSLERKANPLPVTRAPIEWSPVVMTPASFWMTRAP